jgi:solute carrier family 25 phosphate transporter 23/24/25/41
VNVLKIAPESAIKFMTYEQLKIMLGNGLDEPGPASIFFAGAVSGVTAQTAFFPLEVVKTHLAAAPSGTYSGMYLPPFLTFEHYYSSS